MKKRRRILPPLPKRPRLDTSRKIAPQLIPPKRHKGIIFKPAIEGSRLPIFTTKREANKLAKRINRTHHYRIYKTKRGYVVYYGTPKVMR